MEEMVVIYMCKDLFPEIPVIEGEGLVLRALKPEDAPGLLELTDSPLVYRYLPTFLFEKKYPDPSECIRRLYGECLQESLILGIFQDGSFCGLAEMYGYREEIHKISIGYRLLPECWGKGITSGACKLMIRYLTEKTDIQIITASTMTENKASARVLQKNGFVLVVSHAREDWGYSQPTVTDKWIW